MDLRAYKSFDDRFGIIITRAPMTYIVDLDAYELHLGDEIFLNNFINECKGSNIIHKRGYIIIQKHICILMLMTIYVRNFLCVYVLSLVFSSLKLNVYCLILHTQKKTCT